MKLLNLLCIFSIIAIVLVPGTSAFFFPSLESIKRFFGIGTSTKKEPSTSTNNNNNQPAGGAVQTLTAEQKEIVDKHNEYRRNVVPTASNMLEMKWNSQAAANAQRWASKCIAKPPHSPDSQRRIGSTQCGENIFRSTGKVSWSYAITSWHNEVKDYNYDLRGSPNGKVVGHYTQVVWHNSNQIGCGMSYCPHLRYKYVYVCQYCPAGNYVFQAPYKKGKPCGDCPNACHKGLCTKI